MACTYQIGCEDSTDLGCVKHCSSITLTGLVATQDGEHIFRYYSRGNWFKQTITATIGNEFVVSNIFNENAEVCFSITQPDGLKFTDANAKTKFFMKVVPIYNFLETTSCD